MPVLSAGVIVVRKEGVRWLYLLLEAFGYWDFPKGIVEEGEEPLSAAIREVEEETGISDLVFSWGNDYRESAPYLHGRKIARYYLAQTRTKEVDLRVNPEIGRPEHDNFAWVDYETALKMVSKRVEPCLMWANSVISSKDLPPEGRDMDA